MDWWFCLSLRWLLDLDGSALLFIIIIIIIIIIHPNSKVILKILNIPVFPSLFSTFLLNRTNKFQIRTKEQTKLERSYI